MPRQAEVVHHIPGRLRVNVPSIKSTPGACATISNMAATVPGVHRIDANPVTGSVLVHYDRHDPEVEQRLADMLKHLDSLLRLLDPELAETEQVAAELARDIEGLAEEAPFFAALREATGELDQKIRECTDGKLTLAVLAPLLLAGMGYLLLDEKRNSLLLGGLVAMSVQSLVARNEKSNGAPPAPAQGTTAHA